MYKQSSRKSDKRLRQHTLLFEGYTQTHRGVSLYNPRTTFLYTEQIHSSNPGVTIKCRDHILYLTLFTFYSTIQTSQEESGKGKKNLIADSKVNYSKTSKVHLRFIYSQFSPNFCDGTSKWCPSFFKCILSKINSLKPTLQSEQ